MVTIIIVKSANHEGGAAGQMMVAGGAGVGVGDKNEKRSQVKTG